MGVARITVAAAGSSRRHYNIPLLPPNRLLDLSQMLSILRQFLPLDKFDRQFLTNSLIINTKLTISLQLVNAGTTPEYGAIRPKPFYPSLNNVD